MRLGWIINTQFLLGNGLCNLTHYSDSAVHTGEKNSSEKKSVVVLYVNLDVCLICICACLQRSFRRALYGCDAEGERSTHAVVPG